MNQLGAYSKSKITDTPLDLNSEEYRFYEDTIPTFIGQAIYVYSFKENRMVFAKGWENLLGYRDDEITMMTIVSISSPRYAKFSNELNDKALKFIQCKKENLKEYSFTLEVEKQHKNGEYIPLFSRVGVFKANNGVIEEIIGVSEKINTLKLGKVMQYAAYGPEANELEAMLNKELFDYYAISKKEKEALQMAAQGLTFKEIAEELCISQSAIEKRIIPLYKRFDVKSLTHLISFAYENNIL